MNVVGYVRISRDEDRENYSSIITQQDIIREYAEINNWSVDKMYIDDNVSGYTFDRPEFNKMLQALKQNKIDVIIAKDFSRIGRNQGESMVFIDSIKKNRKRLILISDIYDSSKEDDIIGIKAWYNEMYIKDISRKIRTSMYSKQKKGELIMGNFYGYKKNKVDEEFQLIIDEDISPVIELIYKLYIDGLGYKKICDLLNEKYYPTPSECIKQRHEKNGKVFKNVVTNRWQIHMIKRIIHDDIYIGTLTTRKSKIQPGVVNGNQLKTNKDERFVFENHHQAIISKEDFKIVQEINNRRKINPINGSIKYNYIFRGFMKCADCGFVAVGKNIKRPPKIEPGYNCTTYQKYGKKQCLNHSISEMKVLFFFKEFLIDVKNEYLEYIKNMDFKASNRNVTNNLDRLQKELENTKEELKLLLTQKIKSIMNEKRNDYREIIENSYFQLEVEKKRKINELNHRVSELKNKKNNDIENNLLSNIEIFDKIIKSDIPERKNLELILDKVIIHKDRNLEFKLLVNIDKLIYKC